MCKLQLEAIIEKWDYALEDDLLLKISAFPENESKIVLVIPGVEGVGGDIWINLAKSMKGSCYVLQHKNSRTNSTFSDLIDSIVPSVLKLYEKCDRFNIIAHSFGTLIALKMASALETRGLHGKLLLVDGSPKAVAQMMSKFGDSDNAVFDGLNDFLAVNNKEFYEKVKKCRSLDEKIEIVRLLQSRSQKFSFAAIKNAFTTMARKTRFNVEFNANNFKTLENTHLQLARQKPTVKNNEMDHDYGLSDISLRPVDVIFIKGSHSTVLLSAELNKLVFKIFGV